MSTITISEPLCFVSNQTGKIDRTNLSVLLQDFYEIDELIASKKTLISECKRINITNDISESTKKRNNTKSTDDLKEKVVKDILDIWEFVDLNHAGEFSTQFVALNTNRLPSGNSETLNVQYLNQSLNKIVEFLSVHQNAIGLLSTQVSKIHCRLDVISVPETSVHVNDIRLNESSSLTPQPDALRPILQGKRNLNPSTPSFIPTKKAKSTVISNSTNASPFLPTSDSVLLPVTGVTVVEAAADQSASPQDCISFSSSTAKAVEAAAVPSASPQDCISFSSSATAAADTAAETAATTSSELAVTAESACPNISLDLPAAAASTTTTTISNSPTQSVIEEALEAAKGVAKSTRVITELLPFIQEVNSSVSPSFLHLPPPPLTPPRFRKEGNSDRSTLLLSPLFAPPTSFADTARGLKDNGGDWKTKTRRKGNRKLATTGTNSKATLKGVPPISRHTAQFAVYRFEETTKAEDIRQHLHKEGIEVKDVWMLGSTIKGTKTAKIRVDREHEKKAKNPSIWPIHCHIRDWNSEKTAGKMGSAVAK